MQVIGYENFNCTVFDFKTVHGTGQTEGKETGQKLKVPYFTKPYDNFLSQVQVV
jgi:hypothetical protein